MVTKAVGHRWPRDQTSKERKNHNEEVKDDTEGALLPTEINEGKWVDPVGPRPHYQRVKVAKSLPSPKPTDMIPGLIFTRHGRQLLSLTLHVIIHPCA